MQKLNRQLLADVKQAFVPMPGGQTEPVAGASQLTAAAGAPMGGDPAAAGGMPPGDPAAMGGDPAAMGGDPMAGGMPPMDPAMMAPPAGQVVMSIPEFISVIQAMQGMAPAAPTEAAPAEAKAEKKPASGGKADIAGKLDQILAAVSGGAGAGAPPPMDPGMQGMPMDPSMMGGAMPAGGAPAPGGMPPM